MQNLWFIFNICISQTHASGLNGDVTVVSESILSIF